MDAAITKANWIIYIFSAYNYFWKCLRHIESTLISTELSHKKSFIVIKLQVSINFTKADSKINNIFKDSYHDLINFKSLFLLGY